VKHCCVSRWHRPKHSPALSRELKTSKGTIRTIRAVVQALARLAGKRGVKMENSVAINSCVQIAKGLSFLILALFAVVLKEVFYFSVGLSFSYITLFSKFVIHNTADNIDNIACLLHYVLEFLCTTRIRSVIFHFLHFLPLPASWSVIFRYFIFRRSYRSTSRTADWHELLLPQRIMSQFIACTDGQLNSRSDYSAGQRAVAKMRALDKLLKNDVCISLK